MKRLILMGGRPWVAGDGGEAFVRALFRYHPKSVKPAFCIFAQPESEWQQTRDYNTGMFDRFKGSRTVEYQTMTADNFEQVSAWADVMYVPGGDPFGLLEKLSAYDLKTIWDGKIIAGSSAGADLFCQDFVHLQDKKFGKGLGWLPLSCVPHWRDQFEDYTDKDWDWAEQASLKQSANPVLCISEGKFAEFTVN